jgi:hypothetical protein
MGNDAADPYQPAGAYQALQEDDEDREILI